LGPPASFKRDWRVTAALWQRKATALASGERISRPPFYIIFRQLSAEQKGGGCENLAMQIKQALET